MACSTYLTHGRFTPGLLAQRVPLYAYETAAPKPQASQRAKSNHDLRLESSILAISRQMRLDGVGEGRRPMEQTVTGYRKGFGVSVSALDVHGSFDRVMLDDETSKTPQIASLGKCQGVETRSKGLDGLEARDSCILRGGN